MADREGADRRWEATWDDARRQLLESTLAATPAQRLAWLEEMIQLAWRTGALPESPAGD